MHKRLKFWRCITGLLNKIIGAASTNYCICLLNSVGWCIIVHVSYMYIIRSSRSQPMNNAYLVKKAAAAHDCFQPANVCRLVTRHFTSLNLKRPVWVHKTRISGLYVRA